MSASSRRRPERASPLRFGAMDSALGQAAAVAGALLVGIILAWGLFTLLGGAKREARRTALNARGGVRAEWAPGIWHCAACLSTNAPSGDPLRTSCKTPRQVLEHDPVEVRPEWIPGSVPVAPGALVALTHDPAAHPDPSLAHWRLTVGGQVVGSAARRDGALTLLRALDGVDRISVDVRGTGPGRLSPRRRRRSLRGARVPARGGLPGACRVRPRRTRRYRRSALSLGALLLGSQDPFTPTHPSDGRRLE